MIRSDPNEPRILRATSSLGATEMVDTKSRTSAANLICEFAAGRLAIDEFDEQYPGSEDRAIRTIGYVLLSWDDRFTHALQEKYQPTDRQKALF